MEELNKFCEENDISLYINQTYLNELRCTLPDGFIFRRGWRGVHDIEVEAKEMIDDLKDYLKYGRQFRNEGID